MSVCGGEEVTSVVRCFGVPNGLCSAAGGPRGVLGGSPLDVTRYTPCGRVRLRPFSILLKVNPLHIVLLRFSWPSTCGIMALSW